MLPGYVEFRGRMYAYETHSKNKQKVKRVKQKLKKRRHIRAGIIRRFEVAGWFESGTVYALYVRN